MLRGLVHTAMVLLFFFSLTKLPLAEATTLGFTATLMVAPLEWLILGVRPQARVLLASLLGFAGVVVIALGSDPGDGEAGTLLGRLAALAAAVFYALSLIMRRARARSDGH